MMDDKLTQAVQAWLDTPAAERDVPAGALLLFKINRNRVLYANALARPAKLHDKIVYELKKHLAYRVDRKTLDDVVRMNRTVVPEAKELLREQPVIDSDQDVPEACAGTVVGINRGLAVGVVFLILAGRAVVEKLFRIAGRIADGQLGGVLGCGGRALGRVAHGQRSD